MGLTEVAWDIHLLDRLVWRVQEWLYSMPDALVGEAGKLDSAEDGR